MKMPELAKTQVTAIFDALKQLNESNIEYSPVKIEIPLIGLVEEATWFEGMIADLAAEYGFKRGVDYKLGTMIETPSAAMTTDEIAPYLDFMSFGTNDLTQFLFKFSRDDAGTIVIPQYMNPKTQIIKTDPFSSLDEVVVEMIRIAVARARAVNPDIEIELCGEQGGDAVSVEKLIEAGLNATSCSPYRVPIAKLATVQKLIKEERLDRNPVVKYDLRKLDTVRADLKEVSVDKTEDMMLGGRHIG